jgi:hypothetical protein
MVEDSKTGIKISFFSVSKTKLTEFDFVSFLTIHTNSFSQETWVVLSCDSPIEYKAVDASIARETTIMIGKDDFTLQN